MKPSTSLSSTPVGPRMASTLHLTVSGKSMASPGRGPPPCSTPRKGHHQSGSQTLSCGQGSRRSHDSSDLTGRIERRTKSEVLLNSILLHMLSGKPAGTEAVHRTPVSSSHATSLAAMSWFARTLPCSLIGPGRHWQLRFQEWIIMDQNQSDGHFCLGTSSSKPPQQAIGYTTWTARPRPQRVHSGNE